MIVRVLCTVLYIPILPIYDHPTWFDRLNVVYEDADKVKEHLSQSEKGSTVEIKPNEAYESSTSSIAYIWTVEATIT